MQSGGVFAEGALRAWLALRSSRVEEDGDPTAPVLGFGLVQPIRRFSRLAIEGSTDFAFAPFSIWLIPW